MRLFYILFIIVLSSCSVSKNYNPNKKYSKEELQEDYTLLRNILEKKHPSLYWYTAKDSMNYFFDEGYNAISDSMTELQFGWKILAPLTSEIHCGHTSFSMSKGWNKFIRKRRIPSFPLYLKVWNDTMVVTRNLLDSSILKRGTIITSINGLSAGEIIRRMFDYMVEDGYSRNVNYIRLSESFPYFHRNIFGLYENYNVGYIDSAGMQKNIMLPYYNPPYDSTGDRKRKLHLKEKRLTKRERLQNIRSLDIDTTFSLMTINSFSKNRLKKFFRQSFRKLRKIHEKNLIIDVRINGGGDINNYVLLTRFLRNSSFKVADSAFANDKGFRPYTKHISSGFFDNIGLLFVTHKEKDGKYHFGYWERHTFTPKRKNHFNGNVYVLTNGLTFSASALFCNAVKGQDNIKLVGEETGGGWYGNSGILIPDIILPNTKLRVRLPYFRLVQYDHVDEKGTGVIPDVPVGPVLKDIIDSTDTKLKVVEEMIKQKEE
jgi:hypothetical protein